jgi:hypothetical protein
LNEKDKINKPINGPPMIQRGMSGFTLLLLWFLNGVTIGLRDAQPQGSDHHQVMSEKCTEVIARRTGLRVDEAFW